MPIAVSVIVRASSGLRLAHAALCAGVLLSTLASASPVAQGACLLLALLGWWRGRVRAIAGRLDISGVGVLRLTVYQHSGTSLRLLHGSTLWPGLLVLRLGDEDGRVQTLVLLPDSVAHGDWRALALACRAAPTNTPGL